MMSRSLKFSLSKTQLHMGIQLYRTSKLVVIDSLYLTSIACFQVGPLVNFYKYNHIIARIQRLLQCKMQQNAVHTMPRRVLFHKLCNRCIVAGQCHFKKHKCQSSVNFSSVSTSVKHKTKTKLLCS